MGDFDGRAGAVENVKDEHYVGMPKSWEARNNKEMNKGMGYNNMADQSNTAHPPTMMKGETRNTQLAPKMPGENEFNYDKNR